MRTPHAPLSASLALSAAAVLGACRPDGEVERGARLYATMGCAACHGGDGRGGPLAPPLVDLAEHWERAALADYLSDPRPWLEREPRLRQLAEHFSAQMPGVGLPEEERLALADHVLERSAALVP